MVDRVKELCMHPNNAAPGPASAYCQVEQLMGPSATPPPILQPCCPSVHCEPSHHGSAQSGKSVRAPGRLGNELVDGGRTGG